MCYDPELRMKIKRFAASAGNKAAVAKYSKEIQPLDLTFNAAFKRELRECFTRWYATFVKNDLDRGQELSTVKPD